MKREKKIKWIFGVVFLFATLFAAIQLFGGSQAASRLTINPVNLTAVKDGVYPGEAELEGVRIRLEVTVQKGNIISLSIQEHQNGIGFRAEKTIIAQIIQKQTNLVDTVTGASISSKLIMKAVENALRIP